MRIKRIKPLGGPPPSIPVLWAKLPWNFKTGFLSAIIIGTVTHLFNFTNILVNHDSMMTFSYSKDYLFMGRWAAETLAKLGTHLQLPVIQGFLSILALSVAAGITVYLLSFSSFSSVVLAAGFMAVYPTVTTSLAYCNEWFLEAALFAAAGALCVKQFRWGWIPALPLLAIAMGLYQSYISLAIGLLLFDCVLRLLEQENITDVAKRGIRYILTLLGSMALYYAILLLCLHITGTELLTGFKGLDTMGFQSIGLYLRSIPQAYRDFLTFFWKAAYLLKPLLYAQRLLMILALLAGVYLCFSRNLWKRPAALALTAIGVLIIPPALSVTSILSTEALYMNVLYPYVLYYVFCIKLLEMAARSIKNGWVGFGVQAVSMLLCLALAWGTICVDNMAYYRMRLCYDHSVALANRVFGHIESMEEYTRDTPVAFVGTPDSTVSGSFSSFGLDSLVGTALPSLIGNYATHWFFIRIAGIDYRIAGAEERTLITESGILDTMPNYPEQGSIIYWNGIVIVKFKDGVVR